MKKKIIHLIGHLQMGGAEALVTEYGMKIDREAFDLTVVTLEKKHMTSNEEKLENSTIPVVYLGDDLMFSDATNIFARIIHKIQRYHRFNQLIKKEQPNIIHSHLQTNEYLVPLNTRKRNIDLFHTLHNEVDVHFRKSEKIYKWTTQYCIKRKNMHVIALHNKMMNEAKKLFSTNNVSVLHNGINIGRFKVDSSYRMEKRREAQIPENAFLIGHIGRFTEQKNHPLLLKIFEECKKQNPQAHLLLIGSGEKKEKVQHLIKAASLENDVTILENRSDIPELMSAMDVFLFPSLFEGFPIVLLEAQAAGLECVVSETITPEVFITNHIQPLPLDAPTTVWAENVLKESTKNEKSGSLENFDMNKIIKKLQQLYIERAAEQPMH